MTRAVVFHPGTLEFIRISMRRTYAYRMRYALWVLRSALQLLLLRFIWTSVYDGQDEVNGITSSMMLVYISITAIQAFALESSVVFEMDQRIQTGRVANDMARPLTFLEQVVAIDLGTIVGRLPILVILIPMAGIIGSLRLPPERWMLPAYLLSVVLAYLLSMLVWMIIGLAGFWMTNTGGLRFTFFSVLTLFSGAMIPLWFLPGWFRTTLEWLPFQGINFLPATIYTGQVTGAGALRAIGVQVIWVMLLTGLVGWIWQQGQNKLVVQGG